MQLGTRLTRSGRYYLTGLALRRLCRSNCSRTICGGCERSNVFGRNIADQALHIFMYTCIFWYYWRFSAPTAAPASEILLGDSFYPSGVYSFRGLYVMYVVIYNAICASLKPAPVIPDHHQKIREQRQLKSKKKDFV